MNAPSGTYGIMASFEWKNFTLTFRGTDVISLSGESLVFEKSSFGMAVSLGAIELSSGQVTSKTFDKYIDHNSNNIWHSQNAIACKYKLPHNIAIGNYVLTYNKADFLIMCRARVSNPTIMTTFNVYSDYFHQKLLFVGSLSISSTGTGISVSPAKYFVGKQISTTTEITYNP